MTDIISHKRRQETDIQRTIFFFKILNEFSFNDLTINASKACILIHNANSKRPLDELPLTQRNSPESNVQLFEVTCAMRTLHPAKTQ